MFLEMNKFSIVLATVALLVSTASQAQLTKKPENTRGEKTVVFEEDETVKIYGSLMSYTQNARPVVKIEFDEIIYRISPDKSASKICLDLENHRFNNLGEALNVLSSHGWSPELSWTTEDNRSGTVIHMIIAKDLEKLIPIFPWKDKQFPPKESGGSGKSSGKGKYK
tara:strand:+ start:75 stop:575 length:501 start_codon:yes stop_codon:yes gene_type:complete